jgi:hypothetical protein
MKNKTSKILTMIVTSTIGKVLAGFIFAFPWVTGAINYVRSGSYEIPVWSLYLTALLIVILAILWLVVRRIKFVDNKNKPAPIMFLYSPPGGWNNLGYVEEFKVLWNIRIPNDIFDRDIFGQTVERRINQLDIVDTPICPTCSTEMSEKYSFFGNSLWGKYIWVCVGCRYKVRSKKKFSEAVEIVKKKAKGNARRELEQQLNKR